MSDVEIAVAVAAERDRCAMLAEDLAERWERSAAKCRTHTFYSGLFRRTEHVMPRYAAQANSLDDAAHGLRTVAKGIREGWHE